VVDDRLQVAVLRLGRLAAADVADREDEVRRLGDDPGDPAADRDVFASGEDGEGVEGAFVAGSRAVAARRLPQRRRTSSLCSARTSNAATSQPSTSSRSRPKRNVASAFQSTMRPAWSSTRTASRRQAVEGSAWGWRASATASSVSSGFMASVARFDDLSTKGLIVLRQDGDAPPRRMDRIA
jgi:anti-sigma-K factor RskA